MTTDFFKETVLVEELTSIGKPDNKNLIGLAFSGGGERSATLNLGILQGFAKFDALKAFDYLSTVSGGGFTGTWFSSLIYRTKKTIHTVSAELAKSLTANEMANQNQIKGSVNYGIFYLRRYSNYLTPKTGLFTTDTLAAIAQWVSNTLLNQVLLTSLLLILFIGINWLNDFLPLTINNLTSGNIDSILNFSIFSDFSNVYQTNHKVTGFDVGLLLIGISAVLGYASSSGKLAFLSWRLIYLLGFAGVISMLWGNYPEHNLLASITTILETKVTNRLSYALGLGVPVTTMIISLIIILVLGIGGRSINPDSREWWHRLGGVNIAVSIVWAVMFIFAVYLPHYILIKLNDGSLSPKSLNFTGALSYVVTFITAKFGQSCHSSGTNTPVFSKKIAAILPYIVIFGIFLSLGFIGHLIYLSAYNLIWFLLFLLISGLGNLRFDVNIFSLHNFYRNRLTRCYLGATNPRRNPNAFTGFDESDDIKLSDLANQRPYHIINTTLNIGKGKELAWQQRMGASFMFTPKFCGFKIPEVENGFKKTIEYSEERGPLLGSLMAVSGAAASPNSGYHTNPVMGFIMTIFNARLGRWFVNPVKQDCLSRSPKYNLSYLIYELFTNTNANSDYLYLSDGGHFENLGIYELIRRQCKLIVSIDAGQDGDYTFEDLGNAIRKCKTDFGAKIDIEINNLIPSQPSVYGDFKESLSHYAIGEITYSDGSSGYLLYIKSTLTGEEPADLINYKLQEPAFPHHSTVDQFFNESQFESYRNLGAHIGSFVINELKKPSASEVSKEIYCLLA